MDDALRTEIKDALHDALQEMNLDVPYDTPDEAHLFDDLGFDSFDLVDVLIAVEDRLHIRVDETALTDVWTVGDTINVVAAALVAKRS